MDDITDFFVHTVTVETWAGAGAYGDTYQPPAQVTGFLEGKVSLVRNKDSEQVVYNSIFYCAVADGPKFLPDSKVTMTGRTNPGYVITQNVNDAPGLGLPEHAAIYLR